MNGFVQEIKDSIEQAGLVDRLTPSHIIACVTTALICGIMIYTVYRLFFRGAVYSDSFNILNVMTCMVTSFIIMTISANLVLSLGMVGALSIVRFRAAVKDPLDIGFLFLSISAGLTSGAGLYPIALICTVSILIVYLLFTLICGSSKTYLLVVKYSDSAKDSVMKALEPMKTKLKSAVCYGTVTELTVSVKIKGLDTEILNNINKIDGVNSAVLMEYAGD